jgi:hypothetical protein
VAEWVITPPFLTSALDGDEWSASRPGRFTAKETDASLDCIRGWVDSRACRPALILLTISTELSRLHTVISDLLKITSKCYVTVHKILLPVLCNVFSVEE